MDRHLTSGSCFLVIFCCHCMAQSCLYTIPCQDCTMPAQDFRAPDCYKLLEGNDLVRNNGTKWDDRCDLGGGEQEKGSIYPDAKLGGPRQEIAP
jgi:hypothetical protein